MIDTTQLTALVEQEIKTVVNAAVVQVVSDANWLNDLETEIIEFVQQRIYSKFSNIETVPDLVTAVERSVNRMFAQGFVPELATYVDQTQIKTAVDLAVENFVEKTLDALVIDPAWLAKIETQVEQRMIDNAARLMNSVDVVEHIQRILLEKKNIILDELTRDFHTMGISDLATTTQLTVLDNTVVCEKEFVTNDLSVHRNTNLQGDVLISGDLAVQGRINTDNKTWQDLGDHVGRVAYNKFKTDFADELLQSVLDSARAGIEIENVNINGLPLVETDCLGAGITRSHLTQVGNLENLSINGSLQVNNTLTVVNGRIGIDTDSPDHKLSLWDEEVAIAVGKFSKNTAFVGTGKRQRLILGTNRDNHLEIDEEGVVTIKNLKIGRNSISWGTEVPNYSGTKGDVVFNTNFSADSPFVWICLGAFRWQSVKTGQ
jgi:hypothetical protein